MDAFIYQADTYCPDCANKIKADLAKNGQVPATPEDERTYDSDRTNTQKARIRTVAVKPIARRIVPIATLPLKIL